MSRELLVFALLVATLEAFVPKENVTFHLYTKDNPTQSIQLDQDQRLDSDANLLVLIHGWTQNRHHHSYRILKDAYFSHRDTYNVIAVDYAETAAQPYFKAIHDALAVGKIIGDFLIYLGVPMDNIHIIGHSLGAHVAGYAGKHVHRTIGRKVRRITGLDPAGPFFQGILITNSNRLSKHDAEVVFVVHTDRGMFGVRSSCGTVDVYPNGGGSQPGCPDYDKGEIIFCNHHASYEQFADAVANPGTQIATKCSSYTAFDQGECRNHKKIDVGDEVTRDDDGDYYLHTNARKPFGKGLE